MSSEPVIRAAVYTLGCKLNQCESEALASSFDSRGFFVGKIRDAADIYIVNTCTVTSKAEQKARRVIRKLSSDNPESAVIVTGCYAQLDSDELDLGPNVIVVPHDYKDDINRLAAHLEEGGVRPGAGFVSDVRRFLGVHSEEVSADPDRFWYESVDFNYHSRAFLKIQDGCDNSCAYCRVTIARGKSVSLSAGSVLEQFNALTEKGYREIVLTGVNLTSYSSGGLDFSGMLTELTRAAEAHNRAGNPPVRIRISSIEPETIDQRLAEAVASPCVCPHFHISVQSGSDRVLTAMRRHNDREKLIEGVKLLRSVKDDPFFAADVIAGFPGETDEDFELTRSLLDELDFTFLHVFPFSARPGTAAAKMRPQVPQRVSGERTAVLRALSARKSAEYARRWLGREIEVLIEEKKGDKITGTSENYLKTEICDIFDIDNGEVCLAEVTSVSADGVAGRYIKGI